ncbi:MAG: aspartate aminotransferase family protein, partial [Candidatus Omnitrophota bacterium]
MNSELFYKPEDVDKMDSETISRLTAEYINPGMVEIFKILGFDKFWGSRAEGAYITLADGRKILDMTGGSCVLGLGHNHPRILDVRVKMAKEKRLELCKAWLSPYMAALAADMAAILPGDLQYSFFCNSGAEAIEGALKLAQKHHGINRKGIIYTGHSFHGKTHAAMSVSSLEEPRKYFQLLPQCYEVPYGDAAKLEQFLKSHRNGEGNATDICAFIVEAIHGTRLIFPPDGYLQEARKICDDYDVLLILDEIYTGFGRAGYWFAFEKEGIVPDIVCYSKSFGGGKASIAGYTTRKPVFLKAYGSREDAMIHSSTFSGMSEECATALEALNVFRGEKLVERAQETGKVLGEELRRLKTKHGRFIKDVRGQGLLWGVELNPPLEQVEPLIAKLFPGKAEMLPALAGAIVLSELLHRHNVLAYLGFTRRNLIV